MSTTASAFSSTTRKSKWDDYEDDSSPAPEQAVSLRPSKKSRKSALSGVTVSRPGSPHSLAKGSVASASSAEPPPAQSTSSAAINSSYLGGEKPKAGISILGRASLARKDQALPNRSKRIRDLHPPIQGCRSVYCYERLNHIEEGSYGVVFRARDKETGDIVALKKIKMDQEKNGFPITSLREIHTLMMARHENIVPVREIVVGDTLTQIFIVMDFIEHDLKTLLTTMRTPFLASEIKTILIQLLSATALCHDNWIIHRDLKTSNLLMNNRGQIKVADFGLARTYGDPPMGDMTQLVVTLWYRAPELLMGAESYTTSVDLWSIGCIFGELILREPLFPGKGEIDQVGKIFKVLGRPTEEIWPGFKLLPNASRFDMNSIQPYSTLRQKFRYVTEAGIDLMNKLLTYDPDQRITAEEALKHPYFKRVTISRSIDLDLKFSGLLMQSIVSILLTLYLAKPHSLNIPMPFNHFLLLLLVKKPSLIPHLRQLVMKVHRRAIDMTFYSKPSCCTALSNTNHDITCQLDPSMRSSCEVISLYALESLEPRGVLNWLCKHDVCDLSCKYVGGLDKKKT